jgi:hypothetical protein
VPTHRGFSDQDEVPGSSPGRPTTHHPRSKRCWQQAASACCQPGPRWGRVPILTGPSGYAHPGRQAPRPPLTVVATQPRRQPRGRCGHLAPQPLPLPSLKPPATGAPHAGLACLLAQRARAAVPNPARVRHQPPLTNATSQHRPRLGLLGHRPNRSTAAAAHRDSTRPVVTGARRSDLGPTPPPGMGGDGRVRTDGADTSRLDTARADSRRLDAGTGGHQRPDTGRVDSRRPDRRTPGRRTQVTGHRTAGNHTVDTRCWTPTGDRRRGWRPGSVDQGDDARPLDVGWTLRRADASGRVTTQDRSAARTPRAPRCYRPAWPPPRPSAAGAMRPSSWRLGALLSSDDYGSSVEPTAKLHPLCEAL